MLEREFIARFYTYNIIWFIFAEILLMGRVLALDYGRKRTGIAETDELQLIASGLTTVSTSDLIPFLEKYIAAEDVDQIVVGEPRQMNNEPSDLI